MIMANELELACIKTKNPHPQNLTRAQKAALKELKNNHDIIIKPADKGSAVVLMNRDDYIKEGHRQLSDTQFYRKMNRNMTHEHNEQIKAFVDVMADRGELHPQTTNYLKNDSPRTAILYLLPKIHKNKNPPPGRPIISANECPTERISQFVDFFLQPHLSKIKS